MYLYAYIHVLICVYTCINMCVYIRVNTNIYIYIYNIGIDTKLTNRYNCLVCLVYEAGDFNAPQVKYNPSGNTTQPAKPTMVIFVYNSTTLTPNHFTLHTTIKYDVLYI